jgi:hypothetical protein
VRVTLIIGAGCVIFIGWAIFRPLWRDYMRRMDEKEELHRLASDAAAVAGVKFAREHPRELQAAIYGDGTDSGLAAVNHASSG